MAMIPRARAIRFGSPEVATWISGQPHRGRAGAYEDALRTAREEALREMAAEAAGRGADAVIGVDLDYEVLGSSNGMLMVSASGTAVRIS